MENNRAVHVEPPGDESVGDTWLYWDPKSRRFRRVEIVETLGHGATRVRVMHLDPEMRGKGEWAPIGRCRVPWGMRAEYLAAEDRWTKAAEHRPPTAVTDTAFVVLDMLLPAEVADLVGNGASGVLEVRDLSALSVRTGMSTEALCEHPDAFGEDGRWYLP